MLDDLDRQIISILQYDGRTPFTAIEIVAIVEAHNMGWNEAAMIGISVQANLTSSVADEIAKLPEVSYLFQAAGEYDLIAEVYCRDREHFVSFLNDELHQIKGIENTESFMMLKMHKLSYRWGEARPLEFASKVKDSD